MKAEDIKKILEEGGKKVDEELKKTLPKTDLENLYGGILYSVESGGKRLRPILCLETCKRLGGDERKAMPFAVACEIMHNWFLVLDDIQDGDKVRRNMPTTWVKYGLPQSMNISGVMGDLVFKAVLGCKEAGVDSETVFKLLNYVVGIIFKTSEGQTMELDMKRSEDVTIEDYTKMVTLKTGYYLACPMIGGAMIANADKKIIDSLEEIGKSIGPAFQIRDDIIDLTEGKGRNEIGSDIKEGKRSILVVYTASKCSKEEKAKLFKILNKPREEKAGEDVEWVVALFKKYKAVEYAQEESEKLLKGSFGHIRKLPTKLADFLESVGKYIIERNK